MKHINEIMNHYYDFVSWSKTVEHVNDWETDYPNWMEIINAIDLFLQSNNYEDCNEEIINAFLYLIGRDNEREYLAELLVEHPNFLIHLAKRGFSYPDHDTRWQLVFYVSKLYGTYHEVEDIVISYWQDSNEYVRRRALLALGFMKSKYAEELAVEAYLSDYEYQKIAALEVLHMINSPKLYDYLKLSEQSESTIIRNGALRIRTERGYDQRSR
ncbi:HEAT repeat domain-containing protein [Cohnella sp.]|uniref:HEAT repeat domain-containing protein n=1 Tax=Cohnella sp. TaxID=1883426 RepID=UPI0035628230